MAAPKLTICPQCGADAVPFRGEFCSRCGSPALALRYDPFRVHAHGGVAHLHSRARFVVRSGVFGIGVVGLLSGISLFIGGWISQTGLDPVQLWVSRLAGPVLLAQGFAYCWLPFRHPPTAKVIPFPGSYRPKAGELRASRTTSP